MPSDVGAVDDVGAVVSLAVACGATPIVMTADDHDAAVAAVSHLPLVVSAALVETVVGRAGMVPRADWPDAAALAAGGWRDMTRIARGDPSMGAAIATTNAPAIVARLRDLRDVIDEWLTALERPGGPDETVLRERFQAARDRLEPPAGG